MMSLIWMGNVQWLLTQHYSHKSACVFASQQEVRVQSEYSIDALGTKVVADLLYGVKLIDDSDNKKGVKFTNVD